MLVNTNARWIQLKPAHTRVITFHPSMTDLFPPTTTCWYRLCSPNRVAVSVNRISMNIHVSHLIASPGPHSSIPSAFINVLTSLPSCPPATRCMLCSCRRGGSRGSRGGPWGGPWARTRTRSRTRTRTRTWAWAWAWRYVIWSGRGHQSFRQSCVQKPWLERDMSVPDQTQLCTAGLPTDAPV